MHDQSDAQLLRDYAEHGAEAAFAEIITRHTDLVYSAALRQVYSPDRARDVTQIVFTDLARKARSVGANLNPEASLVGWLYQATRFAARNLNRGEIRRTQRERQAMEQLHPAPETSPDWGQLCPALDDAMSGLDDTDREAVLLRYFKNHDLRTVGATLGISDDAAQKRVSRAVERLRELFAKRGVTVGASSLVVAISANAVQAAPAGLAITISTVAALTESTLTTTATITATKAIAMTALQKTIITATIAVLGSAGIYEARQASQLRNQVQTLQQQRAPLVEEIQKLQSERSDMTNQLAALAEEVARNKSNSTELLKLRGDVALLRSQNQESPPANAKPDTEEALNKGFGSLGEYLSVDNVSDAGTSTPEALLQTFVWAIREGKVNRLEEIESLFGGQSKPGDVVGQNPESMAAIFKVMQSAFTNSAGFHLSSKPIGDGQKYRVRLDADPIGGGQNNGSAKNLNLSFVLERKAGGWSFGNPSEAGSK